MFATLPAIEADMSGETSLACFANTIGQGGPRNLDRASSCMKSQTDEIRSPDTHRVLEEMPPANWSGVLSMSFCVFALIASEFMPVSLLTAIATDLKVTEGMAGHGIAISGALAVLSSLTVTRIAGGVDRKILLLGLTALMAISGAVIALAPDYLTYMIGRALIGVVIGGFWSISAAMAMRLVPASQVSKALAIFNGGNALATVIAAPLGSYVGALIGWRGAFFCLIPVAIIVLVWQWFSLPGMKIHAGVRETGNVFKVLRSRSVLLGMVACGAFFMGQFTLFTYVRPFLEVEVHATGNTVTLTLLVIGVSGLTGTAVISYVLKHSLYVTLMSIPVLMAVIAPMLMFTANELTPVVMLLGVWGLLATSAPVGWWSWIAEALPKNAEAGGGLMVAVIQLSIASGSTVGGFLLDAHGFWSVFGASSVILVISALLILRSVKIPTL